MVRINFRAFIIKLAAYGIFSLAFSLHAEDVAIAKLDDITIELSTFYQCTASVKTLTIDSNEKMICLAIEIMFKIDNETLNATVKKAYVQKLGNHYFFNAYNAEVRIKDAVVISPQVLADTHTNKIVLKNGYIGQYNNYKFHSEEDLTINKSSADTRNLHITYDDWKIYITSLKMYKKKAQATKITLRNTMFNITVEEASFDTKIYARKIQIQKTSNFIYASTNIAIIESTGKITFPEKITIKGKNLSGTSENGHFDLQTNKLILEKGSVTW